MLMREQPDQARLGFEALYYDELLHKVNPYGDVGIITLWSPYRTVSRKLQSISESILDPDSSRVAVVANLYGDGLQAMLANLLYNPQIRHLIALGESLGLATCAEIEAFLSQGLEETTMLGSPLQRIVGTERVFPSIEGFDADLLRERLSFRYLGKLSNPELPAALLDLLSHLPTHPRGEARIQTELPMSVAADYTYKPSQISSHSVSRPHPLDCWEELVVRAVRFGHTVELKNGPRLELLNAKAVIVEPKLESPEVLAKYGFSLERFMAYQARILDPQLPGGISYTYGNRLRGYFDQGSGGHDTLATMISRLKEDIQSRQAYVTLWDSSKDLQESEQSATAPCLVSLFFRYSEGGLTLSATYRSHNLLTAWLENVYGLMAIQKHVAEQVGVPVGSITVFSQSLSVDPRNPRYGLAKSIDEGWTRDMDLDRESGKYSLREDPCGYFVVTVDQEQECLIAEHRFGGVLIKRYQADKAQKIEQAVIGDMAVSLVSHALWLGRELNAKEQILQQKIKAKRALAAASGPDGPRQPEGGRG